MHRFSFKKWGNGDSYYEVFLLVDYCTITKRERYTPLGMVTKENGSWVGKTKHGNVTGKTRNDVANQMAGLTLEAK